MILVFQILVVANAVICIAGIIIYVYIRLDMALDDHLWNAFERARKRRT